MSSAESEVNAAAQSLTLGIDIAERVAFAEIAYHFAALQSEATQAVLHGNIFITLDSAIEASTITAHGLLANATSLAVDATRREMLTLGDYLDERDAALVAENLATDAVASAIERALDNFKGPMPWLRQAFANHLRSQILRARDQADLLLRVFSQRPIAGIGLGVWYKPVGWLQAEARAQTIAAVNLVKSEGIYQLNEAITHG